MSQALAVLVDTSAWVETLRRAGDPATRAEVGAITAEGLARLCDQVLLELWNGVRFDDDIRLLNQVEREVESVETTAEVWREARSLARSARARGLTFPPGDILIFACARVHGLHLLHRDAHFSELERIAAEA